MPELRLGTLAAGESRAYRFSVAMLDGGAPSSPYVDDNLYQQASASLSYEWTLTEVEGGGAEPVEPPQAPGAQSAPPGSQPAPAGASPRWTGKLIGTSHADTLIGTARANVVYGLGGPDSILGMKGADYLLGGPGTDWVHGGGGADRLRGGVGPDHIYGGGGPDTIFARDGEADSIDCGSGRDVAYVDEHDRTRGCETVLRRYGRLFPVGP